MKHSLVIFLAFLVHSTFAQHLLIGPKVGGQLSKVYFDEPEEYPNLDVKPLITYQAGIVSNIKVTDVFSLHTEILYQQTGKKMQGSDSYSWHQERYHQLSVPLLLRASFRHGFHEYYFNAGPELSYWLGGFGKLKIYELLEAGTPELKYRMAFGEEQMAERTFFVSDPNRFLLGLNVGIGAMLPLQNQKLMLDLRYHWGHTNMAREGATYMGYLEYDGNLQHASHLLSFSVAYLFEFDFFTLTTKGKSSSKGEK